MCAALLGSHAFTDSDYIGSFVHKGKLRPSAKLEKNKEAQKTFHSLATEADLSHRTRKILQAFTTIILWSKGHQQVNTLCLQTQDVSKEL